MPTCNESSICETDPLLLDYQPSDQGLELPSQCWMLSGHITDNLQTVPSNVITAGTALTVKMTATGPNKVERHKTAQIK